jgi:hypothetical protein
MNRFTLKHLPLSIAFVSLPLLAPAQPAGFRSGDIAFGATQPQAPAAESPQQQRRGGGRIGAPRGVYKSIITPHWFQNDTRFWYTNGLRGGAKEFILVDAEKGTRQPAFDHQKLAAALSKATGQEFKADHLPFSDIEFVDDSKAIKFDAASKTWKCDLTSYECSPIGEAAARTR